MGGILRPRINGQALTTLAVLVIVGFLVLLPMVFLVEESLNVGDPMAFPPVEFGIANYVAIFEEDLKTVWNTLIIAVMATVMAILIGFTLAWILTRTNVPGREKLERLMELPYYMTPLVGALAWAVIAGPKSGFINQLWKAVGGTGDIADIYTHFGIAWVMALFEGTVAFVMISASMKSMDPALEELARVMGASKLRTMLTVTLPLVMPGVLGATLFVFAEMLGSFAAALVLGIPGRIYVITTAIWDSTLSYPPDYGRASAMGLSLFVVMFGMLTFYRRMIAPRQLHHHQRQGVPAAADGHGPARLGAVQRLRALRRAGGGLPDRGAAHDLAAALRHRDPEPGAVDPRQLRDWRCRSARCARRCSTASCWASASPRSAW